jgi:hypothetical protein
VKINPEALFEACLIYFGRSFLIDFYLFSISSSFSKSASETLPETMETEF